MLHIPALVPVAVAFHPAHRLIHGGAAVRYLGQAFIDQPVQAAFFVSVDDAWKPRFSWLIYGKTTARGDSYEERQCQKFFCLRSCYERADDDTH